METTLVPRTGIDCYFLPMAPPTSLWGSALLALATVRALVLIARIRPSVTFATGGYVSVPAVVASWLLRVPVVLFLPDVVPGKAVARLAPLARRIAAATRASLAHLPRERTMVTGYPVRDHFRAVSTRSRHELRQRFDLPPDVRVLCVFGGSQGARAINEALARHLSTLLARYHIIHVCGEKRLAEAERAAAGLPHALKMRYRLFPYLHDEAMTEAMAASDLALCRSGASTLGELPALGLPAILVPLPDPAVHQRDNADVLAAAGAAVVLDESDLHERLAPLVEELLDDPGRRRAMADGARTLDRPDAAEAITRLILSAAAS